MTVLSLWAGLMALFAKIGLVTFGGGLASIPFLYEAFVEQTGWLTPGAFSQIISLAQMTPGPIIVNSATLLGYRYGGGVIGALLCTLSVAGAPLIVVSLLAYAVQHARGTAKKWIDRLRLAMRPVVAAMLLASLWSLTKPVLPHPWLLVITALTALALYFSAFLRAYPQLLLFAFALVTLALSYMGITL